MIWSHKFGAWTFEVTVTGGILLGFTGSVKMRIFSVSLLVITLVWWRNDDGGRSVEAV
jgi:hypothetical protein